MYLSHIQFHSYSIQRSRTFLTDGVYAGFGDAAAEVIVLLGVVVFDIYHRSECGAKQRAGNNTHDDSPENYTTKYVTNSTIG